MHGLGRVVGYRRSLSQTLPLSLRYLVFSFRSLSSPHANFSLLFCLLINLPPHASRLVFMHLAYSTSRLFPLPLFSLSFSSSYLPFHLSIAVHTWVFFPVMLLSFQYLSLLSFLVCTFCPLCFLHCVLSFFPPSVKYTQHQFARLLFVRRDFL